MIMKKLIYLIISTVLLLILSACSNYTRYIPELDTGRVTTTRSSESGIPRRSLRRHQLPRTQRSVPDHKARDISNVTVPQMTDSHPMQYAQMPSNHQSMQQRLPAERHVPKMDIPPQQLWPSQDKPPGGYRISPPALPPNRSVVSPNPSKPHEESRSSPSNTASTSNNDNNVTPKPQQPQPVAATPQTSLNASQGEVLGSHKTNFNDKEKSRVTNITKASDSINGHIVQPGETFSYNKAVGPTIERRGYKEGTIYVQGEKKKGFGGGVCQVSTTLSVAADNAGMTIIERHEHSLPVSYAKDEDEAATSYGVLDFRFKNNKPFPVRINSSVEGGTISVVIVQVG